MLRRVEGTYGLVVLDVQHPKELVVARNGSPLVLGIGESEMFVASDVAALVRYTKQVVYLEDGEVATVHAADYRTSSAGRGEPEYPGEGNVPTTVEAEAGDYELGPFEDFMRKEIYEQPEALRRALRGRLDDRFATARLGGINLDARQLRGIRQVKFLGCGTAYYAGQMGALLVEELARIPSDAEPASEFRYRNPVVDPDTLYVAVSQSGETIDTLMAVQELRRKGGQVIGAVNAVGSAIGRECGHGVFLHAGPEIAVASTKAMTSMAATFAMLGLLLGRVRDLSAADGQRIVAGLRALPGQIEEILADEEEIAAIARRFSTSDHMFFIGRVGGWPVAREGAQKLKEISYVHAEGYQAGELKHGPLALVNSSMPSVVIVPADDLLAKNISTIEQIKARGRPGHRGLQRRSAPGPHRRGDPRPPRRTRAGSAAAQHPAAAAGLSRGGQAGPGYRQAPQPGQERHRRIAAQAAWNLRPAGPRQPEAAARPLPPAGRPPGRGQDGRLSPGLPRIPQAMRGRLAPRASAGPRPCRSRMNARFVRSLPYNVMYRRSIAGCVAAELAG